jgi:hypothetical protein
MPYIATEAVRLPVGLYVDLDFHLMATQPGVKLEAFVTEFLQRWLVIEKERLALRRDGHPLNGFQWKGVFLPDGTNLRTSHGSRTDFAKVVGERIVCEREFVTPSAFANRHATGRNAWRFVWLRFPGQENWIRASDYRARLERQKESCRRVDAAIANSSPMDHAGNF